MPDNNNLSTIKNVYFIGIGGVSMSSLALILKSLGKGVSNIPKSPICLSRTAFT